VHRTLGELVVNIGESMGERTMMTKIICSLPSSFKYLAITWDNILYKQQSLESLTVRLLKEETRNCILSKGDDEGEKAFFSWGRTSGISQKLVTVEEKKKRAAKLAKLKKKTKLILRLDETIGSGKAVGLQSQMANQAMEAETHT